MPANVKVMPSLTEMSPALFRLPLANVRLPPTTRNEPVLTLDHGQSVVRLGFRLVDDGGAVGAGHGLLGGLG